MEKKDSLYQQYRKGKSSTLVLILLLLFGLILIFIPLLITKTSIFSLDYTNVGEIGDIIGGSTAPFIGFVGIIVTFYAFWVQYEANLNQREDIRIERFENQYYEMLRLHKENVQEMEIADTVRGRKCFVRMFEEFKYIYLATFQAHFLNSETLVKSYSREILCDIAYKIFFDGSISISPNVLTRKHDKSDNELLGSIYKILEVTEGKWITKREKSVSITQSIYNEDRVDAYTYEMFYYPFDGHNTRLGHYYRHLYQTVSFIVNSDLIVKHKEKYKYLKLIRAQLSNHEQLLLYYNGLVSFGTEWIENGYFTDYRIIKNIPLNLADFGVKPVDKLGTVNQYDETLFEWLE